MAGSGKAGLTDGDGAAALLNEPAGISAAKGRLYIADTNNHAVRVMELAPPYRVTTVKIEGTSVGAENVASDDDGGNLNPRFESRKSYTASYILTVGTADDDEACYAYRFRVVQ